jgi:hypothetical protein
MRTTLGRSIGTVDNPDTAGTIVNDVLVAITEKFDETNSKVSTTTAID